MLNHILLIDDDEDEHLFFKWSLENININFEVLNAYSGQEGERILRQVLPEIIFLDINLPGQDGFHCLKQLRSMDSLKDVPIYMYSTEINEATVLKAMKMGASGCLKKSRSNEHLCRNLIDILNTEPLLLSRLALQ